MTFSDIISLKFFSSQYFTSFLLKWISQQQHEVLGPSDLRVFCNFLSYVLNRSQNGFCGQKVSWLLFSLKNWTKNACIACCQKLFFGSKTSYFWGKVRNFWVESTAHKTNFCNLRWPFNDYKRRSLPTHRSHWSCKILPSSSRQVMRIFPLLFSHYMHFFDVWGDVRGDCLSSAEGASMRRCRSLTIQAEGGFYFHFVC